MSFATGTLVTSLSLLPGWLDPEFLLRTFGFVGLLVIVFGESAVLIGVVLPGDSLLFTAGLLSAIGVLPPMWVLLLAIPIAAIAGDQTGYWIGRKAGPAIFRRPDSLLFKQEYVERAHQFFTKYGPATVAVARFVPVVRTIVPLMAGVSKMQYRKFTLFNTLGDIVWGTTITTAGFYLGQIPFVREYIEVIVLIGILAAVLPTMLHVGRAWYLQRRDRRAAAKADPTEKADAASSR
ncbi:MAG: DedA family protein [Micromonosporaceae bacterium]